MIRNFFKILIIVTGLSFILITCSDDPPTGSNNNNILADTSEHLVTEVLTYYGGSGWDWGTAVKPTPDGGFIIAGSTDSYGEGKNTLYLIKTDSAGGVDWDTIFGGSGDDNAEAVELAPDGSYIVAGVTSSFTGSYDIYLLKVNSNGSLAWEKPIGTDDFEWGTDMVALSDGYAICGYQIPGDHSDGGNYYLVRTDLDGNVLWSKIFDRPDREWPFALTKTSDGGFVMAGLVHYDGINNLDAYLIKTDDTGKVLWEETYGGNGNEHAFSIIESSDGGLVINGSTRSFSGDNAELLYLFKVNSSGITQWEKYYGDQGNLHGRDIIENPDGTLIFTGLTNLYDDGTGIVKTDASGNLLWNESIGLAGTGTSIARCSDGSYIVTGFARDTVNAGDCDMLLMSVKER